LREDGGDVVGGLAVGFGDGASGDAGEVGGVDGAGGVAGGEEGAVVGPAELGGDAAGVARGEGGEGGCGVDGEVLVHEEVAEVGVVSGEAGDSHG